MNIQNKLTIGSCTLIALALAFTSFSISYSAGKQSSETLEELTYRDLISVRELTGQAVEDYFSEIKGLVQVYSSDPRVVEATNSFRPAFHSYLKYAAGLPSKEEQKKSIENYYNSEYGEEYRRINGENIDTNSLINQLDDNTLALQYQYISANTHPLGNKELFDGSATDTTIYSQKHAEFHPHTREFLYHFGFYDIFIADIDTGHIVYSVFKELDYGTSLIDGAYANSGIGEAFKKAAAATNPEYVYLTDFKEYSPSYDAPASFIASPIYDGVQKVGVLIFQMPIDKINGIMTHHNKWEEAGLEKTGETVLVGQDGRMRSVSRQLVEDKEGFMKLLSSKKLADEKALQRINQLESNILIQTVDNPAIDAALGGEQGEMHYMKYTGEEVLVAYGPLKVLNQKWIVLSEIDLAEAVVPTKALLSKINTTAMITALFSIVVCIFVAFFAARVLMKPLKQMIVLINDLAGNDGNLCNRINNNRQDETGELASGVNLFIEKIQNMVQQINSEAKNLHEITQTMETIAGDNAKGAEQQQIASQQVTQSIDEMSLAANESAKSATSAEQAASGVMTATNEGAEVMSSTSSSIQTVASNVEEAVTIIQELESTSETIGSVVGVINGIAEQTNLPALNAAIEAARAGEQGRGFAVVADEVRALASRTQESTLEINSIIEKLQQNANSAVSIMNTGHEAVVVCVSEAEKAQQALEQIQQQISDINAMNLRIATSAEEQSAVSETVRGSMGEIATISNSNAEGASIATNKAREMSGSINTLRASIAKFSIDECDIK